MDKTIVIIPTYNEKENIESIISALFATGLIANVLVVVGPRISEQMPPDAMLLPIDGAHEVVGVGVLAPGENGKTGMHMHAAMGRSGKTTTGCIRPGVKTWLVAEAIVYEITGIDAKRVLDKKSGFALLQVK